MASTSQDRAALPDDLSRYFGSLQPDELSWLAKLIERFPVPRAECAPDLVQAVARLTTNVPWWNEIAEGSRFSEMARRLAERAEAQTGPVKLTRKDIEGDYGGPFLLTQAL